MRYRNGYRHNDIEITKREVLASISIVAIMLLIGFVIANKIGDGIRDQQEIYNKAIKIDNPELFDYGMRTNVGNAFVYGKLETIDPVTFDEIGGSYMSATKVKERYTRHTRSVAKTRTKSDGTQETYYVDEEYWTWDEIDRWTTRCTQTRFMDKTFNYGQIYRPSESYIKTLDGGYYLRYVYYGSPVSYTGTAFTHLRDNTVSSTKFYVNKDIQKTLESLETDGTLIFFWVFWVILICGVVYGFYVLDNKWLEN